MSVHFQAALTGASTYGDAGFDGDSGTVTFGSNVMLIDGSAGWTNDTYVYLDNANSGASYIGVEQKATNFKFSFKLSDVVWSANDRTMYIAQFRNGSNVCLQVALKGTSSTSINTVFVSYDNLAGSTQYVVGLLGWNLVADTEYTIEVEYRAQSAIHKSDGVIRFWVSGGGHDEAIYGNETGLQFGPDTQFFDLLRFGMIATTTADTGTLTITDMQLASSRNFAAADTLYVSPSGTNAGAGTSGDPMLVDAAFSLAGPGDTISLSSSITSPLRSCRDAGHGYMELQHHGTSGSLVEIDGNDGYVTNTIDATHGSTYEWVESSTSGEYYLTIGGSATPNIPEWPNFIAKCTTTVWNASGLAGLTYLNNDGRHDGSDNASVLTHSTRDPAVSPLSPLTWTEDEWIGSYIRNVTDGSTAEVTDNTVTTVTGTLSGGTGNDWDDKDKYHFGVAGHLLEGQWDYTDNDTLGFSTVYYKPVSGEVMTEMHFEIPLGTQSVNEDIPFQLITNYWNLHDVKVYLGKGHGIYLSSGTGSTMTNVEANYCWSRGLYDTSAATITNYKSGNSLWFNEGGGGFIGNGATGTKQQLYSYNMQDDGFEFGLTAAGSCNFTVVGAVTYNTGISSTDGNGMEISDGGNDGCTVNVYNSLALSCVKGFYTLLTHANSVVTLKSIGAINNSSYGIQAYASNAGSTPCTNLGYYNNFGAGIANVTDSGTSVTADPKMVFNTTNGTYRLRADSAWRGAGVDGAVTGNYGIDGNVFPATDVDIGAMQAGGAVTTSGKVYIANTISI